MLTAFLIRQQHLDAETAVEEVKHHLEDIIVFHCHYLIVILILVILILINHYHQQQQHQHHCHHHHQSYL